MSDGFVIVNKESGFTSHDVVALARKKFGTKKIGHAGTLDPMATGVLVLGVGIGTRLLNFIVDGKKTYEATIRLGATTATDDKEGEILEKFPVDSVTDEAIKKELEKFHGKIMQIPSSVSAIKIEGKAAHQRVRSGEKFEIPAREVEIYKLEIFSIEHFEGGIDIKVEITCSAGTYIRAIARDLGRALNNGGYLTSLNRSEVAPFTLKESSNLESAQLVSIKSGLDRIIAPRTLTPDEVNEIKFGRPITSSNDLITAAYLPNEDFVALLTNKPLGEKILSFPSLVNVKE